jgi:hypothetical protein
MDETEKAYEPVTGKTGGIRPLCLDRRIILKLTFKKPGFQTVGHIWTESSGVSLK